MISCFFPPSTPVLSPSSSPRSVFETNEEHTGRKKQGIDSVFFSTLQRIFFFVWWENDKKEKTTFFLETLLSLSLSPPPSL